jgi:ankyrin repeat protein
MPKYKSETPSSPTTSPRKGSPPRFIHNQNNSCDNNDRVHFPLSITSSPVPTAALITKKLTSSNSCYSLKRKTSKPRSPSFKRCNSDKIQRLLKTRKSSITRLNTSSTRRQLFQEVSKSPQLQKEEEDLWTDVDSEIVEDSDEELDDACASGEVPDTIFDIEETIIHSVNIYEEELALCNSTVEKLFYACSAEKDIGLSTLKKLMDPTKFNPNTYRDKKKNRCTLLHVAARSNNTECMQYLISLGSDINCRDAVLATPLHYACGNNAIDSVVMLLSHGADVNAKDHYETFPMLIAVKNNYMELMRVLVDFKADVHMKTKKGETCLHVACREGYLKRVQYLVTECNASVSRLNTNNEHMLFAALEHVSIMQFICDHVDTYTQLCRMVAVTNCSGQSVIHYACDKGYLEGLLVLIQSLKEKGIASVGVSQVESFLMKHMNEYDIMNGFAPLHIAVMRGHPTLVKYLALCAQVDINLKDMRDGNTALHMAIEYQMDEICNILVNTGKADLKAKNSKRESCQKLSDRIGFDLPPPMSPLKDKRMSLQSVRRSTSNLFKSKSFFSEF